jgi:hypothetical protein
MLDLFQIANDNSPSLENRFSVLTSSASPEGRISMERFAELVRREGRVTINMRPMALISFLSLGSHQNTYEWAQSRAEESGRPAEEIVRERLGGFYERRTTFDRSFLNGEELRYGALNAGGVGTTVYGDYCTVLRGELFEGAQIVAYLKSDSLKTYMKPDGTINEDLLHEESASHSHRDLFAVLKHALELPSGHEERWPTLLCSDFDFIEAIFSAKLLPSGIEAVRLKMSQYKELFEFGFENFRVKLTDERRTLVEAFVLIKKILRKKGIPLEVTTGA